MEALLERKPHYVKVVDVTYFKEETDPDDTFAILKAIQFAKTTAQPIPQPIYFPAGTYVTTFPLEIDGCHLIGEPQSELNKTGTIIRASPDFTAVSGQDPDHRLPVVTIYSERPPPLDGLPLLSASSDRSLDQTGETVTRIYGLTLDAAHVADHGLMAVGGAAAIVDDVVITNTRKDAFIVNATDAVLTNVRATQSGRHSVHSLRSKLALSAFELSGTSTVGSAIVVAGNYPGSEGSRVVISDGAAHQFGQAAEALVNPAAVVLKDVTLARLNGVTVRTDRQEAIRMDNSHQGSIDGCRIGPYPGAEPIFRLTGKSSGNVISSNVDATGNMSPRIQIDSGCVSNHIFDNAAVGSTNAAIPVRFPGSDDKVPTDRIHTLGQEQFVTISPEVPTGGDWEEGDIVLNARPELGHPVGWIYVTNTEQPGFRSLGPVYQAGPAKSPTSAPAQPSAAAPLQPPLRDTPLPAPRLINEIAGKVLP